MKRTCREKWRRIRYEAGCVNGTLALSLSCVMLLCGALTALSCVDGEGYAALNVPLCSFSPFFMVLCWGIAFAVLGTSFAAALSAPFRRDRVKTTWLLALYGAVTVLSYIWIPVACRAFAFLLGTLLIAVILAMLALLFPLCERVSRISAWGVIGYAGWMLYLLYDTFTLFLLN